MYATANHKHLCITHYINANKTVIDNTNQNPLKQLEFGDSREISDVRCSDI